MGERKRARWVGHVVCMWMRNSIESFVGKREGKVAARDLSLNRGIILKLFLKKQVIRVCTGLYWLRKQSSSGLPWTR